MTSANERQVGGEHYKRPGHLEHWDLIERSGIGYLEGCATKYVARWRQKGGVQDLEKAEHYVQKLIELHEEGVRLPRGVANIELISRFCTHTDGHVERSIIHLLCTWNCRAHLEAARKDLRELIAAERRTGGPPQYRAVPSTEDPPYWVVEKVENGVWREFGSGYSSEAAIEAARRLNG